VDRIFAGSFTPSEGDGFAYLGGMASRGPVGRWHVVAGNRRCFYCHVLKFFHLADPASHSPRDMEFGDANTASLLRSMWAF